MRLTETDAFWILGNLPTSAPFGMRGWMKKRNAVTKKLEAIRQGNYTPSCALCTCTFGPRGEPLSVGKCHGVE